MTHASLFSGIGGFDLAAQWAGWTNVFSCDINAFGRRILKYYFSDTKHYGDIKRIDFTSWRGRIDVLSGGFPCQPFSVSGKRLGSGDNRYLWPEMLRAIREIRPRWVVGENVLGIVSWSDGLVFEQVCADLEAVGYEVQPYIIPAAGVDAPHLRYRYRVWFVAHSRSDGGSTQAERERGSGLHTEPAGTGAEKDVANAKGAGFKSLVTRQREKQSWRDVSGWDGFPSKPPVCGGDDGIPRRLDGITVRSWRIKSIEAYGNAVVPQLVWRIFDTINQYETLRQNGTNR